MFSVRGDGFVFIGGGLQVFFKNFPLIIEYGAFHMFLQYLNYFFAKILSGCTVATGSFKVVFTASVMHVAL